MSVRQILEQRLRELPLQIQILEEAYEKIADAEKQMERMQDLRSYERRMKEGLEYLLSVSPEDSALIEVIHSPANQLLQENRDRYLSKLAANRKKKGLHVSQEDIQELAEQLRLLPLVHSSNDIDLVRKDGILPASLLWMTPIKSCANAMDIALGLDQYVFLTQGFQLGNFSDKYLHLNPVLLEQADTLISTVDIFKLVLIRTGRSMPCAIETKEWLPVLSEYKKQIFAGKDFWQLKAEYVLTFFHSIEEYHAFAAKHFYENFAEKSSKGEQPFLGEVKVHGKVKSSSITQIS
jgi:hypothetical protein